MLLRDGGVGNFDVQGTLALQILNQEDGHFQVQVLRVCVCMLVFIFLVFCYYFFFLISNFVTIILLFEQSLPPNMFGAIFSKPLHGDLEDYLRLCFKQVT